MGLCERCADKSASNYHAWCHRQWVLQKAPYLLRYEARLTEKFIRKHIGDYSGYNHRQHVLTKLLETAFYIENETLDDYTALCDYVQSLTSMTISSVSDLVKTVLPKYYSTSGCIADRNKIKTLLYCLNIAAYDLHFCAELKNMYGYREAFNCHRKAVLKFIVDNCSGTLPTASSPTNKDEPEIKIIKVDGCTNQTQFLDAIRVAEGNLGEMHQKWCNIFLGFDYSDINVY